MELTAEQRQIQRVLTEAWARAGSGARIVFETEWLGWLPYGQYQWMDLEHADGKDPVSKRFPSGWEKSDVLAVETAGVLRRVSETHGEDVDEQIVFEIVEEG